MRRAEGLKIAYCGSTIFIEGESYPIPITHNIPVEEIGQVLCDNIIIDGAKLTSIISGANSNGSGGTAVTRFITGMIRSGCYNPVP